MAETEASAGAVEHRVPPMAIRWFPHNSAVAEAAQPVPIPASTETPPVKPPTLFRYSWHDPP